MEEIKQIFDAIKTLLESAPETALWVLLGYAIYKVVMYTSTAGAVVYVIKLIVTKWYDYKTRPQSIEYDFAGMKIKDSARYEVAALLVKLKDRYEWKEFGDEEVKILKDLLKK